MPLCPPKWETTLYRVVDNLVDTIVKCFAGCWTGSDSFLAAQLDDRKVLL